MLISQAAARLCRTDTLQMTHRVTGVTLSNESSWLLATSFYQGPKDRVMNGFYAQRRQSDERTKN